MVATVMHNAAENGCLIDLNVTHNAGPVAQVGTSLFSPKMSPKTKFYIVFSHSISTALCHHHGEAWWKFLGNLAEKFDHGVQPLPSFFQGNAFPWCKGVDLQCNLHLMMEGKCKTFFGNVVLIKCEFVLAVRWSREADTLILRQDGLLKYSEMMEYCLQRWGP